MNSLRNTSFQLFMTALQNPHPHPKFRCLKGQLFLSDSSLSWAGLSWATPWLQVPSPGVETTKSDGKTHSRIDLGLGCWEKPDLHGHCALFCHSGASSPPHLFKESETLGFFLGADFKVVKIGSPLQSDMASQITELISSVISQASQAVGPIKGSRGANGTLHLEVSTKYLD